MKIKPMGPAYEIWIFLGLVAALAICALCSGCVYKGAKVVEGTDLAVGLSIPGTDGAADLTVFNYLSGFRLGVAKDAALTVRYETAETNSWFGVCETRTAKTVEATVTPVTVKCGCTKGSPCGCAGVCRCAEDKAAPCCCFYSALSSE